MWYKALLEVLQHQMEQLSPRLQKASLEQEEDTCALLAAACLHAKAFSGLMQVTKSHQRKQVPASAHGHIKLLEATWNMVNSGMGWRLPSHCRK